MLADPARRGDDVDDEPFGSNTVPFPDRERLSA
jgi:hypothetical protein